MAGPFTPRVRVPGRVFRELRSIARSGASEHRMVQRVGIILLARKPLSLEDIARATRLTPKTVRKWCERFTESPTVESLEDLPRSGRPPEVPVAVRCELIKLACTSPDPQVPPFRCVWTLDSLQDALIKSTGYRLSRSEIHRILNAEEIRPHRVHYWLHSPDPEFRSKVDRICELYTSPPVGATVLCIDEKTCIQALARRRGLIPPKKGRAGRFEFEYRRLGTSNLLAAFEPKTGRVFGVCSPTRKAVDLSAFMECVAKQYSTGDVYVIWDNLNIHRGDRWESFSRNHGGRFHFVYTPIHASWTNQVEIWFGILQKRILRYGVFASVKDLVDRIRGYIRYWNLHEAHPFRWTFRGYGRKIRARRAA